jgi:hypothetical protein
VGMHFYRSITGDIRINDDKAYVANELPDSLR